MARKKDKSVSPQYIGSPLNTPMLNYGVYHMTLVEKTLYSFLAILIGGFAGWIFYGGLFKKEGLPTAATYISDAVIFTAVGLMAAKFFVPTIRRMLLDKRKKALQKQFIDFLEALSASLAAGNTVFGAIVNTRTDLLNQYSEKDYIITELTEIVNGMDNGKTLEEMLQNFSERSGNEDIMNFGNVISNCYRLGGDFSDVVRHTRDIISDKVAVADEIATKIASNKLQFNAMCIMPIILVAMLKLTSADFANNLSSAVGVLVTTISIGIFVASYFWGQKIINIG